MQITYYPGLNNNIQTLICNLPNYEFSKQSVTIVSGVQTVDDNTLKLLLLTDYFSRLVNIEAIVLDGELDDDPPTYPDARPDANVLIAGVTDAGDIVDVGVQTDGSLKGVGGSSTVELGTKIDAATMPTGGVGLLGWVSGAFKALGDILQLLSDRFPALSGGRIPVTGTFWQATQPVSMTTAPAGLAYVSSTLVTRPINTTAYTASDVYGGVFELQNIGASGGFIFLESLDIIFNITAVPSGMSSFTLYLYGVTPPSAIADNVAFSLSQDDRASILNPRGIALSASLAQGGSSVVAEARNLNQLCKLANGSTSLWGYLVTNGAFTPAANSETFTIRARTFAP